MLKISEFVEQLAWPMVVEDASVVSDNSYWVVDTQDAASHTVLANLTSLQLPACPVLSFGSAPLPLFDVWVANAAEMGLVTAAIEAQPAASAMLVQLLRHNAACDVTQGLFAESLAYSTLQQGAGFKAWLDARQTPAKTAESSQDTDVLLLDRHANALSLTLNRPYKHNAYSEALKDELCSALQTALVDDSLESIVLKGQGASFCAGGDLAEFGRVTDAAQAHLSRTTRGAGALLAALAQRQNLEVRTEVQGACIGAGIELPAFTPHIRAAPDAFFQLPEVAMGLVPGAGGTVSITHRIGRQRTAYMALSNARINAQQALNWGLIDAVGGQL